MSNSYSAQLQAHTITKGRDINVRNAGPRNSISDRYRNKEVLGCSATRRIAFTVEWIGFSFCDGL